MDFLKQLNEEYRLFNITDDGIEEIDIDSLLSDDDFDDEGHVIDDLKTDSDEDEYTGGSDIDANDYNKDISSNIDTGLDNFDDEDEFSVDDDSSDLDIFSDLDSDVTDDSNSDNTDVADFDTENPNNYDDEDFDSSLGADITSDDSDFDDTEFGDSTDDVESDIPDFDDVSDQEYITHMNGGSDDDFDIGGLAPDSDVDAGDDEFDLFSSDDYDGEDAQGDLEGADADVEQDEDGDSNFQGVIRTVKGANLVKKTQQNDGTFEELWIFNTGKDVKRESEIRAAILAGTDIPKNRETSDDGSQSSEQTVLGNICFIKISGLPS